MNRLKTYDATGVAPNGRLFSGDLNALQDAVAALTDLAQNLSVGSIAIGESGLLLSRFGAGEAQLAGHFRTSGIVRALGGLIYGAFTSTARDAITLPPFGLHIFNTTTNRIEWNAGSTTVPSWQPVGAVPVAPNTLANIPSASSVQSGSTFYATDQDVDYVASGSSWLRKGSQAGDIIRTLNTVAGTGRVFAQGQAWPSTTGIYAALWAKLGGAYPTLLPDMRGRVLVTLGTHADVNGIGLSDGLGVGSRRPTHKTSKAGALSVTGAPALGTLAVSGAPAIGSLALSGAPSLGTLAVTGAPGINDPTHRHALSPPVRTGGSGFAADGTTGGQDSLSFTQYSSTGITATLGTLAVGGAPGLGTLAVSGAPGLGTLAVSGAPGVGTLAVASTETFGPQTGSEPTDTVAYFVVNTELKL